MVNRNNLTVLEGSANIRFKHATGLSTGPRELFDLGMTYRSSKQMTFLFGINLFNDFRVAYAYNQSFNTGYTLNTTHEIMLECRIFSRASSTRDLGQKDEFWYHWYSYQLPNTNSNGVYSVISCFVFFVIILCVFCVIAVTQSYTKQKHKVSQRKIIASPKMKYPSKLHFALCLLCIYFVSFVS